MKTIYITTNELQKLLDAGLNGSYHIEAIGSALTLQIVLNETQNHLHLSKAHSATPRIFRTPTNLFDFLTRLKLYEGTIDLKNWNRKDTTYKWTRADRKVALKSLPPSNF